ncbi:MAG: DUF7662 domain-containing protein [Actinomycetota bacterium]
MGSGNGRTGTQKLNRFDLEDFSPHRSEDAPSDSDSFASSDAVARERVDEDGREPAGADQVVLQETTESDQAPRRSPADAYRPLTDFLENFGSDIVMISFAALENMIKRKLPPSARERETWWTNKPRGRGHAKAWRDLGWEVEHVDLRKGRVTFTRLG